MGKLSETGRVRVTEDGKVNISKKPKKTTDDIMDVSYDFNPVKFLAETKMLIPESLRNAPGVHVEYRDEDGGISKVFNEATDVVPGSDLAESWGKSGREAENSSDDSTLNYQGYEVTYINGPVHIDPSTGKMHRDDHICNQLCRDLAARAREEYWGKIRQAASGKATDVHVEYRAEDGWITKVFNEASDGVHNAPTTEGPKEHLKISVVIDDGETTSVQTFYRAKEVTYGMDYVDPDPRSVLCEVRFKVDRDEMKGRISTTESFPNNDAELYILRDGIMRRLGK